MDKYYEQFSREIHHTQQLVGYCVLGCIVLGTLFAIWCTKKKLVPIVCGLVALTLAAMIIPSVVGARPLAQRSACINGLRQIEWGKERWAADHAKKIGDIPTDSDLFGTNAYIKFKPTCPVGGIITIGGVGQAPACSLANKGHKL